jgi:hypothetical protein
MDSLERAQNERIPSWPTLTRVDTSPSTLSNKAHVERNILHGIFPLKKFDKYPMEHLFKICVRCHNLDVACRGDDGGVLCGVTGVVACASSTVEFFFPQPEAFRELLSCWPYDTTLFIHFVPSNHSTCSQIHRTYYERLLEPPWTKQRRPRRAAPSPKSFRP